MGNHTRMSLGAWRPESASDLQTVDTSDKVLPLLDRLIYVVQHDGRLCYVTGGTLSLENPPVQDALPLVAMAPPCLPQFLGDTAFCENHGLIYPCYAGSMAHGIASEALVTAMGAAGMLGFYGSAGLALPKLEEAITRLKALSGTTPFGVNLINSPGNSAWEQGAVDLFLLHGVHLVEASAYVLPTPALVRYRVTGMKPDGNGGVMAPNRIIAKVSRVEVAKRFLEPPSPKILAKLLKNGEITTEEADLAARTPLAQDISAEADSGGHTDHRPALTVLSTMMQLAREIQVQYNYPDPPRIGLAGGIGTPAAAAAAYAMGAAYIVTGSVNQACVESGSSAQVRELLARAGQTDVADAPAADMFEMGIKVQVLKKGVRFAERAAKLYDLYCRYESLEHIPEKERVGIEETIFRKPLAAVWEETEQFFQERSPGQLEKAHKNPKHKMALVFRWYLGRAVHWANSGLEDRIEDYQIWCGPSMGAFNDWTKGSFLENLDNRSAPLVALNLLYGAAVLLRLQTLRAQGVPVGNSIHGLKPVDSFPEFMTAKSAEDLS